MADRPRSIEQQRAAIPPAPPAATATSLAGRFELLAELGSGSSGTVHRARLTQDYGELPAGSEVAVKFLRQDLLGNDRARDRLLTEGRLGRRVRHPNVAAIHGIETIDVLGIEVTYLVMEMVQGTTLRQFLRQQGPPVEDLTRRIGADAALGLHALHHSGVVHRDVKPENLVLTPEGQLKIVDLGLARPYGAAGSAGTRGPHGTGSHGSGSHGSGPGMESSGGGLGGTVAYAAPEALRGRSAGPRSDLYALGIVLFEVTTGQHPFHDATTPDEMLHAHLYRLPPLPSHLRPRVSPFLEQVLLDLLQKQPDDRPRSAAELARVLEQGEHSEWWRKHEERAPVLASSRRLLRMRRPAEAPFVGRRQELAALDEALAAVRAGTGRLLAITGPAGIGRRRLCDEAMQRWLDSSEPPHYLGGEADSEFGHAEPFASGLLDVLLRGDDPGSPNARQRAQTQAVARLGLADGDARALVAVVFGDSTEPPEIRADRIATALLRLPAARHPLVVRVDRADELDTSGRLVLQRLAAAAPHQPLLVLLTAAPNTALAGDADRIELAGLDERSFRQFGRSLFRADEPRDGVDAYLTTAHQVLSGLPGNLLEALDHLALSGGLRGRVGDYHALAADAEPRPAPSHLDRFRARVATLEPEQRAVLAAAAVLGERCALADLAALVGASEFAVLATLSLFRGRIVRAQGGEVSFRHRDFRRALLRALPNDEQQRLNAAAADLLAARGAPPLVVGMHRSQALDHEGCLDDLLTALDERVRAGSRRTSLRLVGRLAVHLAKVAATPANERRRLRFLVLSGRAHQNADQADAASRAFRDAERLARALADVEASAAARIGIATGELDAGRLLAALALLESVHDELVERRTPGANALAAQAHELHGRILLYLGQAADGLKHLQAAKKLVPATEPELRCHLLIDLARLEALSHRFVIALRTLQEVERSPAARTKPRVRLRFHLYRGQVRSTLGDEDAGQDLRLALAEAERLALPVYGARAAVFLGERRFLDHRDTEAAERFEQAVALARRAGDRLGEAMARGYLVRLGADDPDLERLVVELDLPSLHVNWLLALAGRGRPLPHTAARLERLLASADLPFALHLRTLWWLERPASARALARAIGQRIPERPMRQRFVAQWTREVRV